MSEPKQNAYVAIGTYLEQEERATVRHEYSRGRLFAMTGSSDAHNVISVNLVGRIFAHIDGSGCRVYTNDMKVRIEAADAFYYPDVMVSCEPVDRKGLFKEAPRLIIEVLSPSTKQIDRREKLVAYQQLSSLKEYVVVHQSKQLVELHRNEGGTWTTTQFCVGDSVSFHSLPNGPLELPLSKIYDGLSYPSGVGEDVEEYELA